MPTQRVRHVAAGSYLNNGAGRVFVFGGHNASGFPLPNVEAYDPVTNTWDSAGTYPDIPNNRSLAAVAKDASGKIYVIGGYTSTVSGIVTYSTIDVFDPGAATPNWSTIPSMPTARAGAAATFGPDGKLYVIGGSDGNGAPIYSVVERYDPGTGTWSTLPSLPAAHTGIGAAAGCGQTIVVVGARSSGQTCGGGGSTTYSYNIIGSTWSVKAPMPGCLGGRGVVRAADDRIYAINDGDYNTFDTRVYSYDPSTDTWATEPSTNHGYTELAAAQLDDQIYAIGGSHRYASEYRRIESHQTGVTSLCNPPPPPPCITLQSGYTSDRFGALPNDHLQIVAYYDGNGTADLDIHLTNPATGACCIITVSGIPNSPFTVQEYVMNGFVPTGKFDVRNVVPNGVVDGIAFGLYWRDTAGARWKLQSRSSATGSGTPNFVGMWPYGWSDATFDAAMPTIVDDGFKKQQARVTLAGAQVLGNGTWGIPTGRFPADTNSDGCVDLLDLTTLLSSFGACCP
ncbi:MAG: hypothetical protein HZB38_12070 [Planctomycetes bacterium]|nr:hypothetical protein [Planctomycetota bacterium]